MVQVFISYSRKDISFVELLAGDLKKNGMDVWYDLSRLEGGSRWRAEIEKAIRNSQYVIVVLSPASVESEWVEREFLFASNLKRKIIPLLYRPCEIPLGYLDLNYIDVQGENYTENFNKLLRVLSVAPTATALPSAKTKKPVFNIKTEYIVAIVGAVATICAALLSNLPWIRGIFTGQTPDITTIPVHSPTAEFFAPESAFTDSVTLEPSLVPTEIPTWTPSPVPTETPTATPYPPETTDPKGIEMVLVPAGTFPMGGDADASLATCTTFLGVGKCERSSYENQEPQHDVYLNTYYIDKYEVTNDSYKTCVNASVCAPPVQTNSSSRSSYYGEYDFRNFPVINVDWIMANTYCEWRGARLPTEAEWEKAARDSDGRTYPWGNDIDCTRANSVGGENGTCVGDTTDVGSYESGQSPYGAYDMGGNVWEWVVDWYSATYYQNSPFENPHGPDSGENRVVRGGAWADFTASLVPSAYRLNLNPSHTSGIVGFRCAVTP